MKYLGEKMEAVKKFFISKDEKKESLGFKKMFLIFIIFSFLGCLYEELLQMIKLYMSKGIIQFVTKRGLLYLELSPIYGWGACLMIWIFTRKRYTRFDYLWIGSFLGGALEFLISFLQETFTGTTSWNYSGHFLNIGGRTTVPFMIFWGLLCYILMTEIYPFITKELEKVPIKIEKMLFSILIVIVGLDMFLSFSACIRLGLRHEGYAPLTFYGEFLDKYYDDNRMSKSYTNMVSKK